ncbi:hypothetical protein CH375_10280 [Leptospira ellisii]|uniref:Uncharacterized protein n=1 Tax=Leptospira ellisii TaxID=2023197 RepID=A0A2N0B9J6_9LEPT|nr:hypothetical protein CH379_08925 [Leptospira ellisii]PKA04544.1 hypothetical protein CH375_10280 [Leptospira ellisii]
MQISETTIPDLPNLLFFKPFSRIQRPEYDPKRRNQLHSNETYFPFRMRFLLFMKTIYCRIVKLRILYGVETRFTS